MTIDDEQRPAAPEGEETAPRPEEPTEAPAPLEMETTAAGEAADTGEAAENEPAPFPEAEVPAAIAPADETPRAASPPPAPEPPPRPAVPPRPDILAARRPLYRESQGYRLRLDPPDLARLRELPGSRGKSDEELGESFFDGQAERLTASIQDDVPTPAEIRVVVDPYSRQAFLALENRIRGIVSF